MKTSTIKWHLARDNQLALAKFCEKHKTRSECELNTYKDDEHEYFQITYHFDNGGYITAELIHGDDRSYTVADHFQVVNYGMGA
jgi:hypothetical protein